MPIYYHNSRPPCEPTPGTQWSMDISRPEDFYAHAVSLLRAGLSVFPVEVTGERAKSPHYRALLSSGHCDDEYRADLGRTVTVPRWAQFQRNPATPADARAWAHAGAQGLCLVTGEISGLVVLDFDGEAGMRLLAAQGLAPHVLTPSGGAHLYVRWPGWRVRTVSARADRTLPEGLDVRGDGGTAMLPPSRTDRGQYVRTGERRILTPRDLPPELRRVSELLERPQPALRASPVALPQWADSRPAALAVIERACAHADAHGRNQGGFWLGCQLRDNGYTLDEALSLYAAFESRLPGSNTKGEAEPYPYAEYTASVRSAYRRPARRAWIKAG